MCHYTLRNSPKKLMRTFRHPNSRSKVLVWMRASWHLVVETGILRSWSSRSLVKGALRDWSKDGLPQRTTLLHSVKIDRVMWSFPSLSLHPVPHHQTESQISTPVPVPCPPKAVTKLCRPLPPPPHSSTIIGPLNAIVLPHFG